ncbi:MAG: 2-keto-4-pentenoate hydratase, partial [Geminicoccaceae bacterium]
MVTEDQAKEAAVLIAEHWQIGAQMDALPDRFRPATRDDGYAIQAHLESLSEKPLFGWKIAATSEGGQRHIG